MYAAAALKAARNVGVRVTVDGGDLVLDAEVPPPEPILDVLRRLKPEIVALLAADADDWSAEDWQTFFDERAGIAEFDGEQTRADAEANAFECAVVRWMNRNPPVDADEDRCAECGGPLGRIGEDAVAVLAGEGRHAWVHHGCHGRLMAARRAAAITALAGLGVTVPRSPTTGQF